MINLNKVIDNNGVSMLEESYLNEKFCISKIGKEIIVFDSEKQLYHRYDSLTDSLKTINMTMQENSIKSLKSQLGQSKETLFDTDEHNNRIYKVSKSNNNVSLDVEYIISYDNLLEKTCYHILNKVEEKYRLFAFNLGKNEILSSSKMYLSVDNKKVSVIFHIESILDKEIPNDLKNILSKLT